MRVKFVSFRLAADEDTWPAADLAPAGNSLTIYPETHENPIERLEAAEKTRSFDLLLADPAWDVISGSVTIDDHGPVLTVGLRCLDDDLGSD